MEARRMDNLSKELVDSYFKASRKSFLDMGYCAYLILFRVLQRMIFNLSYPVYRHYLQATTKEIVNNHKQWMNCSQQSKQSQTTDELQPTNN